MATILRKALLSKPHALSLYWAIPSSQSIHVSSFSPLNTLRLCSSKPCQVNTEKGQNETSLGLHFQTKSTINVGDLLGLLNMCENMTCEDQKQKICSFVFSSARTRELPLDLTGYHMLLHQLGNKSLESVFSVLDEMKSRGVQPTKTTYEDAIELISKHKAFVEATMVLKEMTDKLMVPKLEIFSALATLGSEVMETNDARKTVSEVLITWKHRAIAEIGTAPDAAHYVDQILSQVIGIDAIDNDSDDIDKCLSKKDMIGESDSDDSDSGHAACGSKSPSNSDAFSPFSRSQGVQSRDMIGLRRFASRVEKSVGNNGKRAQKSSKELEDSENDTEGGSSYNSGDMSEYDGEYSGSESEYNSGNESGDMSEFSGSEYDEYSGSENDGEYSGSEYDEYSGSENDDEYSGSENDDEYTGSEYDEYTGSEHDEYSGSESEYNSENDSEYESAEFSEYESDDDSNYESGPEDKKNLK